jgi:hypothetical protein
MFKQPDDVITWLCEVSGHKHVYAFLRSASPFLRPNSQIFQACYELAHQLRDDVSLVTQMLQHHNWRHQVVGNVVAVINRDTRFERVYADKLISTRVHFPSPIAAGWLIVNTGHSLHQLETFLLTMSQQSDTDEESIPYAVTLAVYAALRMLNNPQTEAFEQTPLFQVLSTSSYYPGVIEATQNNYRIYIGDVPMV